MSATYQLSFGLSDRDLQSLESKFQSALECLDSIPAINAGGCGLSALAIYRWCKENGVEISDRPFIIVFQTAKGAEVNDELFENGQIEEVRRHPHIVIERDGKTWDSSGEVDITGYYPQHYQLNEAELLQLLSHDTWNYMFDRVQYLPVIEYGLGVDLSDVSLEYWE